MRIDAIRKSLWCLPILVVTDVNLFPQISRGGINDCTPKPTIQWNTGKSDVKYV